MKTRVSQAGRAAMARSAATQRPISNLFCIFKRRGSAADTRLYSYFVLFVKNYVRSIARGFCKICRSRRRP
jgi:hypothetical protein